MSARRRTTVFNVGLNGRRKLVSRGRSGTVGQSLFHCLTVPLSYCSTVLLFHCVLQLPLQRRDNLRAARPRCGVIGYGNHRLYALFGQR